MMKNFTLSVLLCLTLLNNNIFTGERLMLKKMSENDVVCKKLLTNQTPSQHASKIQDLTFIYESVTHYPYFSSENHTHTPSKTEKTKTLEKASYLTKQQ